jgi:penicillin-binding protein 2
MKRFRPGASFGDFVIKDSQSRRSRIADGEERNFRRGWLVWMAVLIGMGIIVARLVTLQIVYGQRYRLLSDENRVKTVRITAPRGKILDRNGVVLADNLKENIIKDGEIKSVYRRIYPLAEKTAHILGYLGEVAEDEVGLLKEAGSKYNVGDWVGRTGIEAVYEEELRGRDGGRLVEVDNRGEISRELGRGEPVPGQDIRLTAEAGLQETATAAMDGKKGAVVVSAPATGEVLAMVSSPTYDPGLFATQLTAEGEAKVVQVLSDTDLPMFNRAIGGTYPPGSIFKMVTTAAAIDSGKVKPGFVYTDQGVIKVGTFSYYNWLFSKSGGTEGTVGFARALTRSTDTFFYTVGEMIGPDTIAEWGKRVGLTEKTGVDLPGETVGVMPNPEWKLEMKGERWFLGDTYIMSIGQGNILLTPAEANRMTNVWATGGKKCPLHLISRNNPESKCDQVEVSSEALKLIKTGMVGACSPGGTAFPLFDWNEAAGQSSARSAYAERQNGEPLPLIGCKTGTAEYMTSEGKMRTHGWLTAFAPADNPQISVTVLMEGGGEGSNVATPVVRKILAKYFAVTDTYPYGSIRQEISE